MSYLDMARLEPSPEALSGVACTDGFDAALGLIILCWLLALVEIPFIAHCDQAPSHVIG